MIENFIKNAVIDKKPFKLCLFPLIVLPLLWTIDFFFVMGILVGMNIFAVEADYSMVFFSYMGLGILATLGLIAYIIEVALEAIDAQM